MQHSLVSSAAGMRRRAGMWVELNSEGGIATLKVLQWG